MENDFSLNINKLFILLATTTEPSTVKTTPTGLTSGAQVYFLGLEISSLDATSALYTLFIISIIAVVLLAIFAYKIWKTGRSRKYLDSASDTMNLSGNQNTRI